LDMQMGKKDRLLTLAETAALASRWRMICTTNQMFTTAQEILGEETEGCSIRREIAGHRISNGTPIPQQKRISCLVKETANKI
jgi:hypothetical protein